MDAAEENKDVKLYRASGDLLMELQAKLPNFVRHQQQHKRGQIRLWVLDSKTGDLCRILEPFQEWPQLLDPHLAGFIQVLVDAFLVYITSNRSAYGRLPTHNTSDISPLPRSISRLLYIFCKIRGYKIIVRLLNNEPKYLEPVLRALAEWSGSASEGPGSIDSGIIWEERYVLLLWLSHLLLAPFDLASISSLRVVSSMHHDDVVFNGLPEIAVSLLAVAFDHLYVPGKDREAASILIVRLALRADMRPHDLLGKVIQFAIDALVLGGQDSSVTAYRHVGNLSLLSGILAAGSSNEVAPSVSKIFRASLGLATTEFSQNSIVRNSAISRKLFIKILRSALLHAITLESRDSKAFATEEVNSMLEDTIQYMLDALGDKDTPVRMAASKSLSLITLKIDPSMATEVIQAILDSLNENMLVEHAQTGQIVPVTSLSIQQKRIVRKILSEVDPLKWQGLLLTLGHLLFRRCPPIDMLPSIIDALISGMNFEQRSNVGTSIGVGVRDAACFGLWSLARKYSSVELLLIDSSRFQRPRSIEFLDSNAQNTIQIIATELVISACLDPSGNVRRGSSAALQELIGRHPDTVAEGIPLVQTVDYHAVARRSRAMLEVALSAAGLNDWYHEGLLNALLDWRGSRAADVESRRLAASAMGHLMKDMPQQEIQSLLQDVFHTLTKLRPSNTGSTAESRHGLLLLLAAILDSYKPGAPLNGYAETPNFQEVRPSPQARQMGHSELLLSITKDLNSVIGNMGMRAPHDLELVLEGAAVLCRSIAQSDLSQMSANSAGIITASELTKMINICNTCLVRTENEFVIDGGSSSMVDMFKLLEPEERDAFVATWTDSAHGNRIDGRSKGRIAMLGLLYIRLSPDNLSENSRTRILEYLKNLVDASWAIETRVSAMRVLGKILPFLISPPASTASTMMDEMLPIIISALTDYTLDQRGDVGSTLRLEGIEAVSKLLTRSHFVPTEFPTFYKPLLKEMVKLSVEKLAKVRFQAWACLDLYWRKDTSFPELRQNFSHVADVSSTAYYGQVVELLQLDWIHDHLVRGIVSSASAGTEDISRASVEALMSYLCNQTKQDGGLAYERTCDALVDNLEPNDARDDRDIVPTLELLALLFDQGITPKQYSSEHSGDAQATKKLWSVMQKVHTPSSSIQRTDAAIKIYSVLCCTELGRPLALEKLSRMLLHRYPSIRNATADVLFLHTQISTLLSTNWTAPIPKIKPVVIELRQQLGVAGKKSEEGDAPK